ncbi:Uncharacterized protein TCM_023954 [Theobroma cacao]|uniref:DUF4219 domain-containing protein n=1 Tax=Theobroma cacao TaxID=3641 RepID=A0A061EWK3_THECC|nr:Uncharacterized protein TCM_023954 [Theobroma cacao]
MASTNFIQERQSIMRPLLFKVENYPFWRMRFENFIQFIDLDIWDIIVDGPHTFNKTVNGVKHIKIRIEWDDKDKKYRLLNHKTLIAILCAFSESEFNGVAINDIALKVVKQSDEKSLRSDNEKEDDEEITLLTIRFNRFLRNKQVNRRFFKKEKPRRDIRRDMPKDDQEIENIICYQKYPKDSKKKAMIASCSDNDESQNKEEKEATKLCSMVLDHPMDDEDAESSKQEKNLQVS